MRKAFWVFLMVINITSLLAIVDQGGGENRKKDQGRFPEISATVLQTGVAGEATELKTT